MNISKRTFTLLAVGTLALLFYVHEQIAIFQVSYSIGKKEREIAHLSENYKTAKFRVARLRSPHVLSERMKKLSLNLTTPQNQEVIHILKLKPEMPEPKEPQWSAPLQALSLLHVIREAQAKTSRE